MRPHAADPLRREMALEDGRFLVSPQRYDALLAGRSAAELEKEGLVRTHPDFRVIALGEHHDDVERGRRRLFSISLYLCLCLFSASLSVSMRAAQAFLCQHTLASRWTRHCARASRLGSLTAP
jgi:hypothetical protein